MQKKYLEAGEIVSTHGVQGEVKILPWADGPEFLLQFDTFYLDGRPYAVRSARVHKTCVLASLEGIDTPEQGMALRGKRVCIDRDEAKLPEGSVFIADLIGCRALDEDGAALGRIEDVLTNLLDEPSTAVTDAMLDRQIRQLERRQVLNRMSIRFLQNTREYYHTLEQDAGRVWVQNFPEMWRLVLSQEEEARNDPSLQAEKAEWLECMPAVRWVSRLPSRVMEQFRVGRNEYDYGLLVEADAARQLGLRRTDHVELVCGGDYLTTVWKKDYRGSFGWDSLEVLHAEILRRGFRAVGDTFSSILASREQPDGSIINYHLTRTKIYT